MKKHVAFGLADAMLSGPATHTSARSRCAKALGRDGRWLIALCKSMAQLHRHSWTPNARREVAASILAHPEFNKAWQSAEQPAIRFYFLPSPQLGMRPINLAHCALPDLPTTGQIAEWLQLEPRKLDWFADLRGRNAWAEDERLKHYSYRWVPKRSGGHRLLEIPKTRLRDLQRKLLRDLLEYIPPHEAAHGFRARHSCLSNAAPHVGQKVVIRMDLQDFFVSIGSARVGGVFRMLGYPECVARILAGLCSTQVPSAMFNVRDPGKYDFELPQVDWLMRKRLRSPHLPQGAPTSPALANLCAFNLDLRLQTAVEAMGGRYTRYADDLTFSGGADLAQGASRFTELVARIVIEEGYALNFRKTRIMLAGVRQQVTGIVVNEKLSLSRRDCDGLKATLHNCVRLGPSSQNRNRVRDFRAHLAGKVAHVMSVNPARGERMKVLLDHIAW